MADYKHTINLPQTDFPMKADLAQREPAMVRAWEGRGTYAKLRRLALGRPGYEAQQLRAFGRIIRNGRLYKGVKPVHWCLDCRSALAEAEVEYEEKTSPAIDVAFRVADRDDLAARIGASPARLGTAPVDLVIWTTTPWTLPGNQAVALAAEFRYALVQAGTGGERRGLLVGARLPAPSPRPFGVAGAALARPVDGRALEGLKLQHPLPGRPVERKRTR